MAVTVEYGSRQATALKDWVTSDICLEMLWAFFPSCLRSVFIAVNKAILLWVYLGLGKSEGMHII